MHMVVNQTRFCLVSWTIVEAVGRLDALVEMFDNFDGLIKKLQTNETSVKNARFMFRNSTFSRTRLVKFLREVVTKIYVIFFSFIT